MYLHQVVPFVTLQILLSIIVFNKLISCSHHSAKKTNHHNGTSTTIHHPPAIHPKEIKHGQDHKNSMVPAKIQNQISPQLQSFQNGKTLSMPVLEKSSKATIPLDFEAVPNVQSVLNVAHLKSYYSRYLKLFTDEQKTGVKLKESCLKNSGQQKAYQALLIEQTRFEECIFNATDIANTMDDLYFSSRFSSDLQHIEFCTKFDEWRKCFQIYLKSIQSCFDPIDLKRLQNTLDASELIRDLICFVDSYRESEKGNLLNYIQSLELIQNGIQRCSDKVHFDNENNRRSIGASSQVQCQINEEIKSCVKNQFSDCQYYSDGSKAITNKVAILEYITENLKCNASNNNYKGNHTKRASKNGAVPFQLYLFQFSTTFVITIVLLHYTINY